LSERAITPAHGVFDHAQQGESRMKNLREKLLSSWAQLGAVGAFLIAGTYFGAPYGLNLVRTLTANGADPLALWALSAGLVTTVLMFTISRWFAVSDWMRLATADLQAMKQQGAETVHAKNEMSSSLKTHNEMATKTQAAMTARMEGLSESIADLRRSVQSLNSPPVDDVASIWSGITCQFDSLNLTLSREVTITPLAGGRHYKIAADRERTHGNFLKRLQQRMRLSYIVYVPKELGFGSHPAEVLLKLVHVVRCCRKEARATNTPLKATVRIFLIDEPRPGSTVFYGYRKIDGRKERYILEYFRPLDRNNTPTGNRLVIRHTSDEEMRSLTDHLEREVRKSVEIGLGTVERILGPLLPRDDGGIATIVPRNRWRSIVSELYSAGIGATDEIIANVDSFTFRKRTPCLAVDRTPDADLSVTEASVPADTTAEEKLDQAR
jgi:hypothetical protein